MTFRPDIVKIGNHNIKIKYKNVKQEPQLSDCVGLADSYRQVIYIDSLLKESQMKEALLHEILHFIKFTYQPSDLKYNKKTDHDDVEHHFINLYTDNLITIIKENPEVASFIFGE